jgi:hypothetical protein
MGKVVDETQHQIVLADERHEYSHKPIKSTAFILLIGALVRKSSRLSHPPLGHERRYRWTAGHNSPTRGLRREPRGRRRAWEQLLFRFLPERLSNTQRRSCPSVLAVPVNSARRQFGEQKHGMEWKCQDIWDSLAQPTRNRYLRTSVHPPGLSPPPSLHVHSV